MKENVRLKYVANTLIALEYVESVGSLGRKLGYSHISSFSQILNGQVHTPKALYDKFEEQFPFVNANWLRNEIGNAFIGEEFSQLNISAIDGSSTISSEEGALTSVLHKVLDEHEKTLADYRDQLSSNRAQIDKLLTLVDRFSSGNQ